LPRTHTCCRPAVASGFDSCWSKSRKGVIAPVIRLRPWGSEADQRLHVQSLFASSCSSRRRSRRPCPGPGQRTAWSKISGPKSSVLTSHAAPQGPQRAAQRPSEPHPHKHKDKAEQRPIRVLTETPSTPQRPYQAVCPRGLGLRELPLSGMTPNKCHPAACPPWALPP
jgi:hypothetical protein